MIGRRPLAFGLGALVAAGPAFASDEARKLIAESQKGGFVIFFRHGETGSQIPDGARAVMGDCSTQRNLNDLGRAQVQKLGEDFGVLRIPVGKVLTSEWCRCWQHAEAMFGKGNYTITDRLSLPKSHPIVTDADVAKSRADLQALLSEVPAAGTNTVLVSHGANILMLTRFHPNTQGEAVIFRPDGKGGYERLGSVLPEEWTRARR
jgi:phosphohistidine phosphatase SixA